MVERSVLRRALAEDAELEGAAVVSREARLARREDFVGRDLHGAERPVGEHLRGEVLVHLRRHVVLLARLLEPAEQVVPDRGRLRR